MAYKRLISIQKGCSVGIDGCQGKWVVVSLTKDTFEVGKFTTISDICQRYSKASNMLIDVPIGLVEGKDTTRPDLLVKQALGRKGSSIFEVPCRQAVYAESKEDARKYNSAVLGKSLSEQTLGIAKAIRQVDEFLQENPQWKNRLMESHPEFCFMKLNNDVPILEKKSTEEGQQKRISLLKRFYPEAGQGVEKFLADVPSRRKIDDVVDALCLAVTGMLGRHNGFKTVPENPMVDNYGLLMQMVYADASQSKKY